MVFVNYFTDLKLHFNNNVRSVFLRLLLKIIKYQVQIYNHQLYWSSTMALQEKRDITVRTTIVAIFTISALAAPLYASEAEPKRRAYGPTKISHCRTINRPGSYIVTKNLTAEGDCIVIKASNVTLDLDGFVLSNTADLGEDARGSGVTAVDRSRIVVRNGTITNFFFGIEISGQAVIKDINVPLSGGGGITVGPNSIVNGNIANSNDNFAISAGEGSTISGNTLRFNQAGGISAGEGSTVSGNTARENGSGVEVDCPSAIIGNTLTSNDTNFILNGTGCLDVNNVAP
jgi:hypothetical protein